MVYSFARVSAGVTLRVEDYIEHGKRSWLRLHERQEGSEVPAIIILRRIWTRGRDQNL